MLKVGNPLLGMTSMQRKKKIAFDRASYPSTNTPDLQVIGTFCCYFSQKAMKPVRRPPNVLAFIHTALYLQVLVKFI